MDDHERGYLIYQLEGALGKLPKLRMMQLYKPAPKSMEIVTQFGTVTYLRWLELEKARIETDDSRVAELCFMGGTVSLFVNRVAESAH